MAAAAILVFAYTLHLSSLSDSRCAYICAYFAIKIGKNRSNGSEDTAFFDIYNGGGRHLVFVSMSNSINFNQM